jgi:septum formation protein
MSDPGLPSLVLASSSPRRRELLAGLGLLFTVRPPTQVDETPHPGEAADEHVHRLALAKAMADARPGELVLGADTVVVAHREILGKPHGRQEARAMLGSLAGREHTVHTGVALYQPGAGPGGAARTATAVDSARVVIARMTAEEILWYVDTGEPLDKAGAYAVQGMGALFVEGVFGSYTTVVGLPLPVTRRLFGELGYELLAFQASGRWPGPKEQVGKSWPALEQPVESRQ